MTNLQNLSVTLFFTRGVSLQTWIKVGMFEREVALYRWLQESGIQVNFVTYGGPSDLQYADSLPGINILCNRWRLPPVFYMRLLPFLHAPWLWQSDVFKTNQTNGADIALRAAHLWRKPLIARCGYMWSDLATYRNDPDRLVKVEHARRIESKVFNAANRVVVTTPAMRNYVRQEYHLPPSKVQVIPNYVLTDLFSPNDANPIPNRLCFIGRLSQEKNPLNLVKACAGLNVELVMVGDGPLRESIMNLADELDVNLQLMGSVSHLKLPDILRQSVIFLLVSPYEGHPKTLLEAMACGLPVIGTDSPGIRELIRHKETGWLCGADAANIRAAIRELLAQPKLRAELGRNARSFAVENFALDRVAEMELQLLHSLI